MNKYRLIKILLLTFVALSLGFMPQEGDETPVALIKKIVKDVLTNR